MQLRRTLIGLTALILVAAVLVAIRQELNTARSPQPVLQNVRAYSAATRAGGADYAVDAGALYTGKPGAWTPVPTPPHVIVGAVTVETRPAGGDLVYIGAANELAVYRSDDRGASWLRVPLSDRWIGGVTSLAFDPVQRLLFAGTDTAGLFRLRDVGSSLINGGHLLLDAPVRQVVVDRRGRGLALARTDWELLRAEQFGLRWVRVDGLHSSPTALVLAGDPATIYAGTVDRGVLTGADGLTWTPANTGLGIVPGSRLRVDALAVDPLQPQVLYVATRFLYGTVELHATPARVALSTDGGLAWSPLGEAPAPVAELLPVNGQTGAVYALTTASRTPAPLGRAAEVAATVPAPADSSAGVSAWLAWVVAGLAGLALVFAVASDLRRRPIPAPVAEGTVLEPQPAPHKRH